MVRKLQKLLRTENITVPKGLIQRMLATIEDRSEQPADAEPAVALKARGKKRPRASVAMDS